MKRSLLVAAGALLSLGAGIVAHAQSEPSRYVIKVPFSFFVGTQELSAGTYYVDSKRPFLNSSLSLEFIHKADEAWIALPQTATLESKDKTGAPKLVFHQYGGAYFLSEFWNGHGQGKKLAESAQESEMARKQSPSGLSIAAR
jgi:hypothetical protein